jgi:hypothetical protein
LGSARLRRPGIRLKIWLYLIFRTEFLDCRAYELFGPNPMCFTPRLSCLARSRRICSLYSVECELGHKERRRAVKNTSKPRQKELCFRLKAPCPAAPPPAIGPSSCSSLGEQMSAFTSPGKSAMRFGRRLRGKSGRSDHGSGEEGTDLASKSELRQPKEASTAAIRLRKAIVTHQGGDVLPYFAGPHDRQPPPAPAEADLPIRCLTRYGRPCGSGG